MNIKKQKSKISQVIQKQKLFHSPIRIEHGTLSETISRSIVNKIISYAITKSLRDRLYSLSTTTSYTFNYMKSFITPLIQLTNIKYDIDNDFQNSSCIEDIPEQKTLLNDRHAYSFISFKKISNDISDIERKPSLNKKLNMPLQKQFKFNMLYKNIPLSEIPFERETTSPSKEQHVIDQTNNDIQNVIPNKSLEVTTPEYTVKHLKTNSGSYINDNVAKTSKHSDIKKDKDKYKVLTDLPCYDIKLDEEEQQRIKFCNEAQRLRNEIERRKKIKHNKQLHKNLNHSMNDNNNNNKSVINSNHNSNYHLLHKFNFNKFTIDGNGRIIPIHHLYPKQFQNEFQFVYAGNKLIKKFIQKQKNEKAPKIEYNDNVTNNNNQSNSISNNSSNYNSIPTKPQTRKLIKVATRKNDKTVLGCECIASGDNFEHIKPEVGVVIKQNELNKIKTSTSSFYMKYKKYSQKEYSSLLNETNQLNNNTKTKHIVLSATNTNPSFMESEIEIKPKTDIINDSFIKGGGYFTKTSSLSQSKIQIKNNSTSLIDSFYDNNNNNNLPNIESYKHLSRPVKNENIFKRNKLIKSNSCNNCLDMSSTNETFNTFNQSLLMLNKYSLNIEHSMKKEQFKGTPNRIIKHNDNEFVKRNGFIMKALKPLRVNYSKVIKHK